MKRALKSALALGLSLFLLVPSVPAFAQIGSTPSVPSLSLSGDVVWENGHSFKIMSTQPPLASYAGANGVTINSYSSLYASKEQLEKVYEELLKNTIGSEVTYLSRIDIYPNYPYGNGIAGRWYGLWKNNKLAQGRSIELYGADSLSFTELSHTLSHEYGHHFTHYYLNLKEGVLNDLSSSGFAKLRNLSAYSEVDNGSHEWAPEEIAAEDYAQLFGSASWKKGLDYPDVRDVALNRDNEPRRISSLENYNVEPQENSRLPYAFEVPELYSYWIKLSGITPSKDNTPPSRPYLSLTEVEGKTATLSWTQSTDNLTKDIRYTVVYTNSNILEPMGLRTTSDSTGRDAIIGSYKSGRTTYSDRILSGKTTVWVNAQDEAGNIIRSNTLVLDENNLQASISALPNRISGSDRYATSVELSKNGWPNGSTTALLVTGNDFPDALSAAPLAKRYKAPILLTGTELDSQIEQELNRLGTKQVIIVGGTGVVPQRLEDTLKQRGLETRRISGDNRYTTALEVAKELGSFDRVFIATGENFPDALSAAPIAASLNIPILLTDKNTLPESVQAFLMERSPRKSYVLGGSGVISENLASHLPNPERISGSSRYETNSALLNVFKQDLNLGTLYLATGSNFPDALSGSVVAALTQSPILLTDAGNTDSAQALVRQNRASIMTVQIIGGDGALSNDTVAEIMK